MNYHDTETVTDVLDTLKAYRDDLHNSELLQPHWPLLERLIARETQMRPVWENIARQGLSREQCHTLLEQIFFAGAYGTKERNSRLKADHKKLVDLNVEISAMAAELAAMLMEREDILNRNAFSVERMTHIVDLIDTASEQNGRYRFYLREPLNNLRCQYDGKYWPSLQQLLEVAAREIPETEFIYESEKAIATGRGEVVPDYLRELFDCIENARESHFRLPAGFTLTDASLAMLAIVSLDLDEDVTPERVKTLRNRLHKEDYPGAWSTPKKMPRVSEP